MNNQVTAIPPLVNSNLLQQCSIHDVARNPALIVAPHPDDETLGCGGAISLLCGLNYDVRVLVISDGTLSHPRSKKYPADKLRVLRESETLSAVSLLGVENNAVTFLRLPDGSVTADDTSAVASCKSYLTEIAPKIIFLPWRYDPHPDHRASWKLIQNALGGLYLSPRQLEYPIWDWDSAQRKSLPESLNIAAWQLDVSTTIELKQQAIRVYRSQTTNLIDDDPEGFRLTPEMLANFAHPWEIYLEEII
ncbi:MAG: PIG-L family deacetylase [Scytonematopsis contorta HA4267-MV1]|jgi:LmbE family N-acetylglucosaminyl deacetylase|nr:PIG-L family deacetylase [Scytonematopsis contorta HA4267-MV1]